MKFLREYVEEHIKEHGEERVKYDKEMIIRYIEENNLEYDYMKIFLTLAEKRNKKLKDHLFGSAYISKQDVMRDAIKARDEYDEDWCGYEIANEIIDIIEEAEEF